MMEWILFVFYGIDILATYLLFCLSSQKERRNFYEENSILKFCWKKFGFHRGTRICFLITLPVVYLLVYISSISENFFFLFLGIYIMIINLHYINFKLFYGKNKKVLKRRFKKLLK